MKFQLALIALLQLVNSCFFAQEFERVISDRASDCDGAMTIIQPGSFELEFTGKTGLYFDLSAYSSLEGTPENNSLWAEFVAPFDGEFSLNAFCDKELIELIVFAPSSGDACSDIYKGLLEIQRVIKFNLPDTVGLTKNPKSGFLQSLHLNKDEQIYISFNVQSSKRKKLHLAINYEADSIEEVALSLKKIRDFHYDVSLNTISILLQDAETGLPVEGQVYLNDGKKLNAMYRGTDFIFDIYRDTKLEISADVQGYFFYDRTESIKKGQDYEFIIWLEPISKGKQIEIPGIEFKQGTSILSPATEDVLRRLRDFLLLNSSVQIEIQGHVHSTGEGSLMGKKMSYDRAQRVMNYLIDSGIDKDRMTAVGYGNEFMKYPEPKFANEEQANRRVEIKIL